MTVTVTVKIFSMIWPREDAGEEWCDEYYRNVHVPLAIEAMRPDPSWESYYQNHVTSQYDLHGTFAHPKNLWRLVILRGDSEEREGRNDPPLPLAGRPNPPSVDALVRADHRNFIGRLRRFETQETLLQGSPSLQSAFAKYVLFLEDASGRPRLSAEPTAISRLSDRVLNLARAGDVGLKMAVSNDVLGEMALVRDGDSIIPGTTYLASSTAIGFLELWFDNEHGAGRFFASDPVRQALNDGSSRVCVYAVSETVGFDRRSP